MVAREGPFIYITDMSRSTPRAVWQWYYRLLRVMARESRKAEVDMMLFGAGYVKCYDDGRDPQHIPIEQVRL